MSAERVLEVINREGGGYSDLFEELKRLLLEDKSLIEYVLPVNRLKINAYKSIEMLMEPQRAPAEPPEELIAFIRFLVELDESYMRRWAADRLFVKGKYKDTYKKVVVILGCSKFSDILERVTDKELRHLVPRMPSVGSTESLDKVKGLENKDVYRFVLERPFMPGFRHQHFIMLMKYLLSDGPHLDLRAIFYSSQQTSIAAVEFTVLVEAARFLVLTRLKGIFKTHQETLSLFKDRFIELQKKPCVIRAFYLGHLIFFIEQLVLDVGNLPRLNEVYTEFYDKRDFDFEDIRKEMINCFRSLCEKSPCVASLLVYNCSVAKEAYPEELEFGRKRLLEEDEHHSQLAAFQKATSKHSEFYMRKDSLADVTRLFGEYKLASCNSLDEVDLKLKDFDEVRANLLRTDWLYMTRNNPRQVIEAVINCLTLPIDDRPVNALLLLRLLKLVSKYPEYEDMLAEVPPYLFEIILPQLISRLSHKSRPIALNILRNMSSSEILIHAVEQDSELLSMLEGREEELKEVFEFTKICKHISCLPQEKLLRMISHLTGSKEDIAREIAKFKLTEAIDPDFALCLDEISAATEEEFPEVKAKVCHELTKHINKKLKLDFSGFQALIDFKPTKLCLMGRKLVGISPIVQTIPSKSRPKKMKLIFEDGQKTFLLKANEDLHLDQRLTQMISLFDNDLLVKSYAVIPIGPSCGLLEWVEESIPFYSLYKQHIERSKKEKPLDEFKKLLETKSRQEAFRHMLATNPDDLLLNHLRCTSKSPYDFLMRQDRLSESIAAMSILGYLVGLGDRHLDNILLNDDLIVHIDFNVSFDLGKRLKIPETVAFRNTRNIEKVVTEFNKRCHSTFDFIRSHKELVLLLLESFIHSPIVSWEKDYGKKAYKETEGKFDADLEQIIAESKKVDELYEGWAAWI